MPKLQNKIQSKEDKKQSTLLSKKRENPPQAPTNKQLRNALNNSFSNSHLTQNAAQTFPKSQLENKMKDNFRATTEKNEQNKPNPQLLAANRTTSNKPNVSNAPGSTQPGQTANLPINFQNFMNMPNPPANFPAMINPNQMLNNLNLMGMSGLNGLNPM